MFWHQTFRLVLYWRGSERSILRRKVARDQAIRPKAIGCPKAIGLMLGPACAKMCVSTMPQRRNH
jgi:hypothetical protein